MAAIHSFVGDRKEWRGRKQVWRLSDAEAILRLREMADAGDERDLSQRARPSEVLAKLDEQTTRILELATEINRCEAEYRSRPWSRFFLVTSSDGHIHSSMDCTTCRPSTEYGWKPQLSGKTEADAVADLGPLLCTVCFPSAPSEYTRGKETPVGCAGTGQSPYPGREGHRYQPCRVCGSYQMVTLNGTIRKHKPAQTS